MRTLWARIKAWHARAFPCMTEDWGPGGPLLVPCDVYWAAHQRALDEIGERRRIARERATRPEYV